MLSIVIVAIALVLQSVIALKPFTSRIVAVVGYKVDVYINHHISTYGYFDLVDSKEYWLACNYLEDFSRLRIQLQ